MRHLVEGSGPLDMGKTVVVPVESGYRLGCAAVREANERRDPDARGRNDQTAGRLELFGHLV